MCGIAGAIDLQGRREFPLRRLLAMTAAIEHRGPDDEHVHIEEGGALGARRLSIVDLAGGRQPLSNESGDLWVAFNGELFEYKELRAKLLAEGHHLATRCDTEAWVHLYEDHGEAMFDHARGQFAVSLWDRPNRTLILGRDRVGICPLYYAERDGWLLWGSEIKALLASGLVEARPDPMGVDYFFTFFAASLERTFFEGVKMLPPGHFLRIHEGRVEVKRYWDLDFPDAGQERRVDDVGPLVDEFEDHLRRAVERRLRGDVPVVSYISGGLDSTVVLGLSSRERGQAVPSFTIGLDRAGPDERAASTQAARALGSKMTMITMDSASIANTYPALTAAAEVPVLDTSCACLLRLAQTVHDHGYKVALTGEGADEALAGYVWFKGQKIRNQLAGVFGMGPLRGLRSLALRMIGGKASYRPPLYPYGNFRTAQQDIYDFLSQARVLMYSPQMWERLGDHSAYSDLAIPGERMSRWAPLNQSLYVGYKVMLAGMLMISKGDRIAMNASVETRYPFLDDDVIRFCSELSPDYKLHGKTEKWILRQVAAKTLPAEIANRPKTMFRSKLAHTFLGPSRPAWVDQLLSPESINKVGFFDHALIARQRELQVRLPRVTPTRLVLDVGLTCVVSTQLWHHIYCGGGLCDLPVWTPKTHEQALPRDEYAAAS